MAICELVIKDEVNCQLKGLDLSLRKTLVNRFKFVLPYARYSPAVRLGRWDGKVSFFQMGGSTYINLLPDILPLIDEAGYTVEVTDQREYRTQFNFSLVAEDSFSDRVWPAKHPNEGQPIRLRDYQVQVINSFLANPQCLQEIATGAGKTLITAILSHKCEPYGRTVVIVPNKSLVTQTEGDYRNMGLDVGVYYGDRKETGHQHTICTWQSLNNLSKGSKDQTSDMSFAEFLEDVVCVVVDECFDGDTKVLTTSGYVPIKNICPGDQVINYSESTNEFKVDTVVKRHLNLTNSLTEKMYELKFDNGAVIKVTGNHKFLTKHGWVRADEITKDDEIISLNINTQS